MLTKTVVIYMFFFYISDFIYKRKITSDDSLRRDGNDNSDKA